MPRLGYRMTKEHKDKIVESNRLARLGFYVNKEKIKCLSCEQLTHRDTKTHLCISCCKVGNKINLGRKRKPFSEEWKRKIGKGAVGNKYNLGRKASSETRIKMSLAKKGKLPQNNGIIFGVKGKKLSQETRRKISESHRGVKSYRWKGGIEPENKRIRAGIDFRLWRESVFERDNHTCQKYGIRGGKLHPHHIQNFSQYPELRFVIANGITLSEKAHKEFHKVYGSQNNTKEQIQEYIAKREIKEYEKLIKILEKKLKDK